MNKIITLDAILGKDIGTLSFFETNKEIPFDIKRIYYIYDVPIGVKRGMHAHKKLKQVLWCPFGEIEVILDDGAEIQSYQLNSPEKLLLVGVGVWRSMIWKKQDSVLCVAASDYYEEEDYIRNYDDFLKYISKI